MIGGLMYCIHTGHSSWFKRLCSTLTDRGCVFNAHRSISWNAFISVSWNWHWIEILRFSQHSSWFSLLVGSTSSNASRQKNSELMSTGSTATVSSSGQRHAYTYCTHHRPHTPTLIIEATCCVLMFINTSKPTLWISCKEKNLKISQCITTDRPSCFSD